LPGNARVAIELGSKAERLVDPRLTRRLIQLELGDVEVPPLATGVAAHQPPALFYRVLSTRAEEIRVELWERGEFHGARSVSLSRGTAQLHARRIALAAAELARRLRGQRIADRQRLAGPKTNGANDAGGAHAGRVRPGVAAAVRSAALGPSALWLLGPELAGRLRFGEAARLELSASWMHGQAPALSGAPGTSAIELGLAPGYGLSLGRGVSAVASARFAAAAVHFNDVRAVDGIENQRDTWSARAGLELRLESRLTRNMAFYAAPEVGVALRRIPVEGRDGARERLGGLWLGGALGVSFDD
jgi:hypothetical protein